MALSERHDVIDAGREPGSEWNVREKCLLRDLSSRQFDQLGLLVAEERHFRRAKDSQHLRLQSFAIRSPSDGARTRSSSTCVFLWFFDLDYEVVALLDDSHGVEVGR